MLFIALPTFENHIYNFSPPLLMCTDRVTGPLHMLELLQYQHLLSASWVPPILPQEPTDGTFLFRGKEILKTV